MTTNENPAAVRVCAIADIQCSRGCGTGACKREAESLQPTAAPADLQGLRRSILTSREIVRDQDGMLSHPAVPYLDEDVNYETFFAAFGIEATFIHMEDDVDCDTYDRYFASNSPDCCTWTPSSPQGDGWMLLEIYDTEDGPVALYVREKKPESMRERWKREKRESDAAAPSPADARMEFVERVMGMFEAWPKGEPGPTDEPESHYRFGYNTALEDVLTALDVGSPTRRAASANETGAEVAQQLSAEIAELKIKLVSYEREREDQTRYLAAQSEEIADLKQQLAHADARVGLTAEERLVAMLNDSGQSEPETATVARIEQLRKALFESRDAMRVMSNWAKKPDPAGHSWAVRMVDRANAALNGEPEPRAEVTEDDRRDAERYRWLCDGNGYFLEEQALCGHWNQKEEADAAIDAVRRTTPDREAITKLAEINGQLREQIERYQAVCAAAYQLVCVVDGPLRFLDALSNAANGEPMSTEDALNLLPVTLDECDSFRAAPLAIREVRDEGHDRR
ncbi:hypothetical protein [Burkholderia pseudomallei]|uniref:hypothetical protein n=1 Tax=Burkholderia pseudomallei TaxID=28450 RepID=UPI00061C6692|nr:hypothetical protein [Burkholderia pseudomallei]CPF47814.1 gp41 [Burkholderia pseudomallei]